VVSSEAPAVAAVQYLKDFPAAPNGVLKIAADDAHGEHEHSLDLQELRKIPVLAPWKGQTPLHRFRVATSSTCSLARDGDDADPLRTVEEIVIAMNLGENAAACHCAGAGAWKGAGDEHLRDPRRALRARCRGQCH
jgi:hypothetical protein